MLDIDELKFDERGLIPADRRGRMDAKGADAGLYEPRKPRDHHEGGADLLLVPLASGAVAERARPPAIISTSSRSRPTATATRSSLLVRQGRPRLPPWARIPASTNRVLISRRARRSLFLSTGSIELLAGQQARAARRARTRPICLQKGLDKILKKVGEESTEVIIAAKAEDRQGDHLRDRRPCVPS